MVKLFPGGVLRADLQAISALQGGTLHLTVMNAGLFAGNVKEFAILDSPHLFKDAEEKATRSWVARSGRSHSRSFPKKG
jgi:TRAP-type transport system periplasmic protein